MSWNEIDGIAWKWRFLLIYQESHLIRWKNPLHVVSCEKNYYLLENKIRMNGEKTVFSCKTKKTKHSTSPWFHFNLLTLSKWMHAATAAIQKLQTYKHDYKHAWLETISTFFSSSFYICFAVYISHQTHTIHFIQVAVQAVDACINLSIFLTLEYIDVRIVLLNSLFSQRFRWFSLSSSAD